MTLRRHPFISRFILLLAVWMLLSHAFQINQMINIVNQTSKLAVITCPYAKAAAQNGIVKTCQNANASLQGMLTEDTFIIPFISITILFFMVKLLHSTLYHRAIDKPPRLLV